MCVEDELRLADGGADFRGRVEICRNEMWGTVCNEMWSASDANVVCRQLGYSRHNATASSSALSGSADPSAPILFTNVACSGAEAGLLVCSYDDTNLGACTHSNDASVTCQTQ